MTSPREVFAIAVPMPVRRCFDYLPPEGGPRPHVGARVRVPFGRRRSAVGVVIRSLCHSELPVSRLKRINEVLDAEPLIGQDLLGLLEWAADYYYHPLGEVVQTCLPAPLRAGRPPHAASSPEWMLTGAGREVDPGVLARAPLQRRIHAALAGVPGGLDRSALVRLSPNWSAALKVMVSKGWVSAHQRECLEVPRTTLLPPPTLTRSQRAAVEAITSVLGVFQRFLLYGVTGSGKTEVYMRTVERVLAQGRQALVLVPEIALTPQLVQQFRSRFRTRIALLHSALTDQERLCAWLAARDGRAPIVLGARSAIFVPLKNLGLIVVDEEHDSSYKQQEGFRYHARDVAVMRARREGVPVILGSATPSLESLNQAALGVYRLIELPDRTAGAVVPRVRLLDMRRQTPTQGLSHPLRTALAARLVKGEQSLFFLNRRGFAPAWMCHDCGWLALCRRCDARLVLHRRSHKLRCHHCGVEQDVVSRCPTCQSGDLRGVGEGTERIEDALASAFPHARVVRIDRDSTRRKGALQDKLARIRRGEADILIGTQMLSKGHDFPNVTLVGVINADQGLYSTDFRAAERLFQLTMQVAGRAGRADKPGEVLVQTWHPDHPVFSALQRQDYRGFADYALAERRECSLPPFSYLALLRAESPQAGAALDFLRTAYELAHPNDRGGPAVEVMEPVPSPMERRAGRYRAQLLVQASKRAALHTFLSEWLEELTQARAGRRVRWSLDVDPIDLY